jgi:hypothetical protein
VTGHRRRLLEKLCGGLTDSRVPVEQCLAKDPGRGGTSDFTESMHGIPAEPRIVIALHDRQLARRFIAATSRKPGNRGSAHFAVRIDQRKLQRMRSLAPAGIVWGRRCMLVRRL